MKEERQSLVERAGYRREQMKFPRPASPGFSPGARLKASAATRAKFGKAPVTLAGKKKGAPTP